MNAPSPIDIESFAGPLVESRRLFKAPRERVFDAFENPEELKLWWGPKDFRNTIHAFDFRAGGSWRFTMHGPDGADYPNGKEFLEVAKPERIVFLHMAPMHLFHMAMSYEDQGGNTLLTWRMRFRNPADEGFAGFIAAKNEENFDRLEAHLIARP